MEKIVLKIAEQTHCTSLHLVSQRCVHLPTPLICRIKPVLFDIRPTLNAIDISHRQTSSYLSRSETASVFRPPLARLLFSRVPEGSCVSCSVSDWLWPPFTADAAVRGEHTLSGSLSVSSLLRLAAGWRQWHHPFFSLSLRAFILWPFLYCLYPVFRSAFPRCQTKNVRDFICDWQDLFEAEGGESQSCRGVMTR